MECALESPPIKKPPPLNKGYNRDPIIKALRRRGLLVIDLH